MQQAATIVSTTTALHVLTAALVTALATSLGALPFLFSKAAIKQSTVASGSQGAVEHSEDEGDEADTPYWLRHAHSLTAGMMIGCAVILIAEAFQADPTMSEGETSNNNWVTADKGYVLMGISLGIVLVVVSQAFVGDAEYHSENTRINSLPSRSSSSPSMSSSLARPQDEQRPLQTGVPTQDGAATESEDDSSHTVTLIKSTSSRPYITSSEITHDMPPKPSDEEAMGRVLMIEQSRTPKMSTALTQSLDTYPDKTSDIASSPQTKSISSPTDDESTSDIHTSVYEHHANVSVASAARKALLVMLVMFAHSFAEGVSLGVSWAKTPALGGFVSLSLAVHNIPEGLAVSLTVIRAGGSVGKAALWSFLSSLPQPIAALPAYFCVQKFAPLLPLGLGFAAGAMLWLPISELLPEALADRRATRLQVAMVTASASLLTIMFGLDWERAATLLR